MSVLPSLAMHSFPSTTKRRMAAGLSALALLVLANPLGGNPAHAAANPPGNNGTVKIDGKDFDTHPNNEPHVGCIFQVDFYGFDEGDLTAKVTFTAQPPTGKGEVLLTDDGVKIGEDDNSGGGSEAGLDAEKEYNLSQALAGYTPHPKQGYHVKLTVNAEGSQGADTKHKVFWVESCADEVTPVTFGPAGTPAPMANPPASPALQTKPGIEGTATPGSGADVLGTTLTQPATGSSGGGVLGEGAIGSDAIAPNAVLARTGSPIAATALLGFAVLALGATATRFSRTRRA